jgi:Icc-related predicted phosphoesterase
MKWLVSGDTHAKLRFINKIIKEHPECSNVLQLGDFGIWTEEDFLRWGYIVDKSGHWDVLETMAPFSDIISGKLKFDRPVVFITGNHENFNYRDSINWVEIAIKNDIRFLHNESVTIDKIKIVGLCGCYSYKVYTGNYQKRKKIKVLPETPPHIEEYLNSVMGRDSRGRFTEKNINDLKKCKADILLLHEVPRGLLSSGDLAIAQKPGASPINELIEEMQPRFAFCGHMHKKGFMKIGNTNVWSLETIEHGCGILDIDSWEFKMYEN